VKITLAVVRFGALALTFAVAPSAGACSHSSLEPTPTATVTPAPSANDSCAEATATPTTEPVFTAAGGFGTVTVGAAANCYWTWTTLGPPSQYGERAADLTIHTVTCDGGVGKCHGNGVVTYEVDPNTTSYPEGGCVEIFAAPSSPSSGSGFGANSLCTLHISQAAGTGE
jgi:hypothetical protein